MKKRTLRITIIFVGLLVVTLGFVYLTRMTRSLSRIMKTYVEGELKKAFHREVTVEKISTNVINRITLQNVAMADEKEVSEGTFLVCDKVTISYNPILILLGKRDLKKGIGKIALKAPRLLLTNRTGKWNFVLPATFHKESVFSTLPPIVIADGKVTIEDAKERLKKIEIRDISGSLTTGDRIYRLLWQEGPQGDDRLGSQIHFNLFARSNQSRNDKIRLKGTYSKEEKELSINLNVSSLDLPNLSNFFPSRREFTILTGEGNLSLDLNTTLNEENYDTIVRTAASIGGEGNSFKDLAQILSFSGELTLQEVSCQWLSHKMENIGGMVVFDNHRIGSQEIILQYAGSEIKLSGGLERYLSQPALGVNLSGNFWLSRLPEIVKAGELNRIFPLEGLAKVSLDMTGSLSTPKLKGWFLLPQGKIRGRPVEEFQGQFVYENRIVKIINLQGKICEGTLVSSGNIDTGRPYVDLDFVLRDIDLSGLLPPYWTDNARGRGSLSGDVVGKPLQLQVQGEIDLREAELWGTNLGTVSGILNYANGELEIEANSSENNYLLNTSLLLGKKEIQVSRLEISAPGRAGVVLAGRIGLPGGKKLQLTVRDSYVETGNLPWFNRESDRFSGRVSFQGQIGGTIGSPEVSGKLYSTGLKVIEEEINFDSAVDYREKILKITSFKLNDVYSANLTVSFHTEIPMIKGSVESTGGDLKLISTLFSDKQGKLREIAGTLRGEIGFSNLSLSGSWWENVKAKGAVSVAQAGIGKVSFDELVLAFNLTEQKLSVDKFRFSRKTGEVTGSARMEMRKGKQNTINVNSEWRDYPINFSVLKGVERDRNSKGGEATSWIKSRENGVSGSIDFTGKLAWKKDWVIRGSFSGKDFKYSGEPLGMIDVDLLLKRELINFSSFRWGNDLKGNFSIELAEQKTISGGIEVDTVKVPSILRLIFAPGQEKSFLNNINGKLYSKILLQGLLENPQIKGYVDIERGVFSTTNFLFKSTFDYNAREINLESAELKFVPGGRVLAKGKIDFNKPEPWEINVAMEHLQFGKLQSLLGEKNLNTFGEVNGNLRLHGAFARPRLKAELESENLGVNSLHIDTLKTEFRMEKVTEKEDERVELVFDSFQAGFGKSLLRLAREGRVEFSLSRKLAEFSLFSEVRNINLAKMSIFGSAEVSGVAEFSTGSPVLEVKLSTRDLWVNRHNFESAKLRLSYRDRKLFFLPMAKETFQLLGEIDFERVDSFNIKLLEFFEGKDKLVSINGNADLSGPIDLTVQGREGRIAASLLGELLNVKIPLTGKSGFDLKLSRASIKKEKGKFYDSLQMEGRIDIAKGSIGNLLFDDFYAVVKTDGDSINLRELAINKKEEYRIKCQGTIPYPKEEKDGREIDLSLEVFDSRAGMLRVLTREIRDAKGQLEALVHITGTLQQPLMNGYFRVQEATVYGREIFKRIDDLTCDISVKDSNIVINRLNGKVEKGEMDLKGKVTLAGWKVDKLDLVFENKKDYGIPLKIPFLKIPQSSIFGRLISEVPCSLELKGKIHVYGTSQSYDLVGAIEVENAQFTYPPRTEDTKDLNLDFLMPAVWNLQVKAGKNAWYKNRFAEVQVQGSMTLTGPSEELTVNGTLTAVKGEINYLEATFNVKEATVECINDELFLQVRAECPVEGDTIMLVVERGKWGKIKPKFSSRSDPEMSEQQALVKATGLDSLTLSSQEGDALLRRELLKLIDSSLASPLIKSILKSLGMVDVVKVEANVVEKTGERLTSAEDPEQGEKSSLLEGTKITLGKYLSDKLYLGYKVRFEEGYLNRLELRHELELLYRIRTGTSLRGRLGQEERYLGVERQIRF
ncbi:hypothetical protein GTN66_02770 [bacterium]|nr:hypothetical protein [bacterium]NIN92206.1 hypothetical protein [bacterium]NIO18348.1 hypothetical protein [bacterium]NIO73325.1 hypothetical protein [bacterium]